MIFILNLTKEEAKAIRSRITWGQVRIWIEGSIKKIAHDWIEEDKRDKE